MASSISFSVKTLEGIDYVEDSNTLEWCPTFNRISFDNFLEDYDYKMAVQYSDGIVRRQYMKDALKIADVQKSALAVTQQVEPYDIFICYKDSDERVCLGNDALKPPVVRN